MITRKISVIIPLRITEGVYQAKERLLSIIKNIPNDKFNILIVNYGTPSEYESLLHEISHENVEIRNFDTKSDIFSIGHARDLGVQHAKDDVVMFNDIDFFANTEMYNNIYNEVISRNMHFNAYDFFCVPVFFLTEQGSIDVRDSNLSNYAFNNITHRKIYESHNGFVDFPAYGSSAIVVNKNHYLGIGGHSREFYGHGAEDYDVLHRLSSYYSKGPRTSDYYLNTKSNDIKNYRGFRAYFSLYGIDIFNKGIFLLHLWHPKRVVPGYHQTNRNFSLLESLMKRFDQFRDQPFPLCNKNIIEKTLILIDTNSKSFKAIRHAMPFLGELDIHNESHFENADELLIYIQENKIDKVLFLNPYGNSKRLSFYKAIRERKVSYLIFDRGALPNSWFFDPNGFNYDSSSYLSQNWDVTLSEKQNNDIEEYIFNLRNGEDTLEFNAPRKSSRFLHEKYQIGNRKVLFVPFQRPSDTVTTHFSGPAKSVSNFQNWLKEIKDNLKASEWVIICKNHPLEKGMPKIDGVIYADEDTHIHDLIELSSKVLLMNSGVGLISLAFNKPVICVSNSFYCQPGLAFEANSPIDAIKLIKADLATDKEKVKRFYWHLINNIYSFGVSKYKKTKASDGSERNIVLEIIFESLNLGKEKIELGSPPKGVSLDAPLFYSFGGRDKIKQTLQAKPKEVTKGTVIKKTEVVGIKANSNNLPTSLANVTQSVKQPEKKPANKTSKKIKKLFKNPALFFKDAFKNRANI